MTIWLTSRVSFLADVNIDLKSFTALKINENHWIQRFPIRMSQNIQLRLLKIQSIAKKNTFVILSDYLLEIGNI
jgi:hypothetical protein